MQYLQRRSGSANNKLSRQRAGSEPAPQKRTISHTPLLVFAAASLFAALPSASYSGAFGQDSSSGTPLLPSNTARSTAAPATVNAAPYQQQTASFFGAGSTVSPASEQYLRLVCTGLAFPVFPVATSLALTPELYTPGHIFLGTEQENGISGGSFMRRAIWGGAEYDDLPGNAGDEGPGKPGNGKPGAGGGGGYGGYPGGGGPGGGYGGPGGGGHAGEE